MTNQQTIDDVLKSVRDNFITTLRESTSVVSPSSPVQQDDIDYKTYVGAFVDYVSLVGKFGVLASEYFDLEVEVSLPDDQLAQLRNHFLSEMLTRYVIASRVLMPEDKFDEHGPVYDQARLVVEAVPRLSTIVSTLESIGPDKIKEIKSSATCDGLTGLYNRNFFDTAINAELNRARRNLEKFNAQASGESTIMTLSPFLQYVSLLMVDLDNFKYKNDTHGHQYGDEVLRAVAYSFGRLFYRPSDIVARYGGEEFAIVLPATASEQADMLASKVVKHMPGYVGDFFATKSKYPAYKNINEPVTVSLGVATFDFTDIRDPQDSKADHVTELVSKADEALYYAKKHGKNRFKHWNANL